MPAKAIIIDSLSTPDRLGYNDRVTVLFDDKIVWHDSCRSSPNPYQPSTGKKWDLVYGWIAPCSTDFWCVDSPKHGKCLLLNSGAELPARYQNVNHDNRMVVSAVEVHCGETEDWPGSAACITIAPSIWQSFINNFELGDNGQIAIIVKGTA
jgi:hypothetical protein